MMSEQQSIIGSTAQAIVNAGGFVTAPILRLAFPNADEKYLRDSLKKLAAEQLLFERTERLRMFPNTHIYQVKLKACRQCGRGDSHMRRRNRKPTDIRRGLIRAHALCDAMGKGVSGVLFSPAERERFLISKGCHESELPQKQNRGHSMVQIEEIRFTNLPQAPSGGMMVMHIDRPGIDKWRQLKTLAGAYRKVVAKVPARLCIVTDNDQREQIYRAKSQNFISLFSHTFYKQCERTYTV